MRTSAAVLAIALSCAALHSATGQAQSQAQSQAQAQRQTRVRLRNGHTIFIKRGNLANFTSTEVDTFVTRITRVAGLSPNFETVATDDPEVENAVAAIDETGARRFILYRPQFFASLQSSDADYWAAMGTLAHEIAHHLNNDPATLDSASPETSRRQELAADRFAGTQLARLRAPAEVATALFAKATLDETSTHPSRSDRIGAFSEGWCVAHGGRFVAGVCNADPSLARGASEGPSSTERLRTISSFDFALPPKDSTRLPDIENEWYLQRYAFGGFLMADKDYMPEWHMQPLGDSLPSIVNVSATAVLKSGSRTNATWGIGFGANADASSFYAVLLSTNGELDLVRWIGGTKRSLSGKVAQFSARRGVGAQNTIVVKLADGKVAIYLNEKLVRTQTLESVPSGRLVLVNTGHKDGEDNTEVIFLTVRTYGK